MVKKISWTGKIPKKRKKEKIMRDMRMTVISSDAHILLDERKWEKVESGYIVGSEKLVIRISKKKSPHKHTQA